MSYTSSKPLLMLEQVVTLILTPTAVIAGLAFVIRELFRRGLQRDVVRFKSELQSERESSKAKLQTELQARLYEFQTHFSAHYDKQAEVIGRTYELLFDPYQHIKNLVHPLDEKEVTEEEKQKIADLYNELAGYYGKHKIYLPQEITERMDEVLSLMKEAFQKNLMARRDNISEQGLNLWKESWDTMREQVPPLMENLEEAYRDAISVPPVDVTVENEV